MERFFRFALFIIGVIVVLGIIFAIVRNIAGDGPSSDSASDNTSQNETQTDNTQPLQVAGSNSTLNIRGPIVGREDSYQVNIVIDSGSRKLTITKGDDNTPVLTELRSNDQAAYEEFLGALAHNGVTDGVQSETDPRGYCYDGELYELTYQQGTRTIDKWDSNCDNRGDLDNDRTIVRLFERQFPDFDIDDELEAAGLDS